MDAFITHSRPIPAALFISQDIRDRGSLFSASIYSVSSPSSYKSLINTLKAKNGATGAAKDSAAPGSGTKNPATHTMSAFRCMILKANQTGLSGPSDFTVHAASDDDGEKWGGSRIAKVIQNEGVLDAVVVVRRWYGGIMLGPARFDHIETCTREVCRMFKKKEELEECISSIRNLDGIMQGLREELAGLSVKEEEEHQKKKVAPAKAQDYSDWTVEDLAKAKRILIAREKAVASVQATLAKRKLEAE
ncbi:hypothetical protein C8J56DRAFT_409248 [Mycena floridula]|nr:hypothetical protein C8J56DRAFT_409248 [Mycena floridula]